jgi:predicted transcriptional regulator
MAYSWEMFLIEHFRVVKELHYNDYESYIIMQVINSHFIYNKKKDKDKINQKSWNDLFSLASSDYSKEIINKKNRLTVSSISRVCCIPLETTRRKLHMLSDKGLIEFNKNSINLGKNHAKAWSKIGAEEARLVKDFTSEIKSNGALDWLDSDEAEKIIQSKSSKARK